ncbi:MAG: hypothetical protein M3444_20175 [Acidobacteriota bacterium]|nr:hypothetical protein [Acidobacteriota bacterium]MDQ5837506.1 hypothetical protein [Acidobacteriota bacterium]
MKTTVCAVCLSIALPLFNFAALAQAPPAPQDARCQEASKAYASSVVGGPRRTPDEQKEAVYEAGKKYLQTCGDRGDSFTRSVKMWVSAYEAAKLRRAVVQVGARLGAAAAAALMEALAKAK